MNSTWSTNNDVDAAFLEFLDVLSDDGTTDAGMDLNALELSDGVHNKCNLERKLSGWGHDQCLDVV